MATTVPSYIAAAPKAAQSKLRQLRKAIMEAAPSAEEYIGYGMPAYREHGVLVYFAAFKNHIGLYATPSANVAFAKELAGYETAKGSIKFPLEEPLPIGLVKRIVRYKRAENRAKR